LISNAYRNLISVSIETNYDFEGSAKVKEYLKDPSAFQSSSPVEITPSNNTNTAPQTTTAPVEEKKEKDEESAEIGGLFGDDD